MYDVCPLCGGKIKKGKCRKCGYKPPEESDIIAAYSFNPDTNHLDTTEDKYVYSDEKSSELYHDDNFEKQYYKSPQRVTKIVVNQHNNQPAAPQQQYNKPKQNNTKHQNNTKPYRKISYMNNKKQYYGSANIWDVIQFLVLIYATMFIPIIGILGLLNYVIRFKRTKNTFERVRIIITMFTIAMEVLVIILFTK